jgi:Holliday junction DNA helicase RuvA
MYAFLRGAVAEKQQNRIELDVNGVGFDVLVPARVQDKLLRGQETTLLTHCHIREDAFTIFGFLRDEDRKLFRMLLSVSGIGPRAALAILSRLSVPQFAQALQDSDVSALTQVEGIGKKTAQRIVLEMKARMGQDAELGAILGEPEKAAEEEAQGDDVIEALTALGCTLPEARRAAAAARDQLGDDASDEEYVRAALRTLAKT